MAVSLLGVVLALACSTLLVKGAITQPPIGSWNAASSLSQPRAGASAVLLQDGRILVTGGDNGSGPSATADFVSPIDGSISPAPPMLVARERHVSVTLQDGRVLVAGGVTTGGGITNEAEIYDPASSTWSSVAGGMVEARAGATATLLQNGEVLVAGGLGNDGVVSSSAEIFDPNSPADKNPNAFAIVTGNLSSPRENHAAALLNDGRVLIVGGSNGTAALATSDIYDPATGTVTAGPAMATARQELSATTLLNGLVLVAGGIHGSHDLASLELFDPSANSGAGGFSAPLDASGNPVSLVTARQGQQAVPLPHNGAVLIFGGTSSGVALSSAELFTASVSSTGAWSYSDAATSPMTTARSDFAASPLSDGTPQSTNDGLLLAIGGTDASGNTLSSTELYGFPWVKSDQSDYSPGTTATITGSGWQSGETVQMSLVESPLVDNDGPLSAVADSSGNISVQFPIDSQDANVRFYLTAVGQTSGREAQATFTDISPCTSNCGGGGGGNNEPDLTASKTDSVKGSTTPGNSWTWSITVSNIGNATATFQATNVILQDDLPNSNVSYGTISGVPAAPGIVVCGINSSDTLTCSVGGIYTNPGLYPFSLAAGSSFTIQFTATPSSTGTYANPRSAGICEVDPSNVVIESNESNNSCSDTVTVGNTGSAAKLAFHASPGSSNTAGVAFGTQPVVYIEDSNGNLVTSDNSTAVTLSITTGTGTAGAGLACAANPVTASGGIATFSGCNINLVGTNYQLHATSSPALTAADSSAFNVSAGTASKLAITTTAFTKVVGQCSPLITVQTQDSSGNPSNVSSNTTVNLSSSSGGGKFYSDASCSSSETSVAIASGTNLASFYYSDSDAGTPTLTAAATGFNSGSQAETIEPKLGFTTTALTILQGQCSSGITVETQNGGGNAFNVTSDTPVALSSSSGGTFYSDSGCSSSESSATITSGSSSVTFYYKDTTVGGPTLTASAFSNATQTMQVETIAKLAFSSSAFSAVAGECSPQITLQAQNSSSAPVTLTMNASVTFSTSSSGGSFFSNSGCTAAATNPITSFTGSASLYYKDTMVGTPTLKATAYGFSVTQGETIGPRLVFTSAAFTVLDGQCSTAITVQTQNGDGSASNVASDTAVALSSSSGGTFYSDSACSSSESSATISSGNSSVTFYYKDTTVGGPTLTASAFSGASQATQVETIGQLAFSTSPFTVLEGECSPGIAFQAQDASDKAVNLSASATVNLSSNSPGTKAFYSDASCATALPGPSMTIASGTSTSPGFYYKDTALGGPTLTASAYSASGTQVETIAKLAFTSSPVTDVVGQCSTAITIGAENASSSVVDLSENAVVDLSSTSSAGAFYSDASCATALPGPPPDVAISSGNSSASFYYEDSKVGSPLISASDYSASATQTETVTGIPTITTVTSNLAAIQYSDDGLTLAATVTAQNGAGGTPTGSVTFELAADDTLPCSGTGTARTITLGTKTLSFSGTQPTATASLTGVQINDACAWSKATTGDGYTVKAVFTSTNSNYLGSTSTNGTPSGYTNPTLTVNPEVALTTTYTGATFVPTSGSSAPVPLAATVAQDTGDGYIASFDAINSVPQSGSTASCSASNPTACRVYVAFTVIGGTGCSSGIYYAPVVGSTAVGTATVSPTLGTCGYLITATVVQQPVAGNSSYLYWAPGTSGNGGVVIANGTGPNTSGGGWLPDASAYNGKDNFGFTVKFNKKGTSLQGNSMFMYRTVANNVCPGGSSSELVNTQVKTNSLDALGQIGTYEVVLTAKASVNVTDAVTGALVCSYGAGSTDNFTQTVWDSTAYPPGYYQMIVNFGGTSITIPRTAIGGGEIVVHTGD